MRAYLQGAPVFLQSTKRRVRLTDAGCVTSPVCVVQPQQQRVDAFMELLKIYNQYFYSFTCEPQTENFLQYDTFEGGSS